MIRRKLSALLTGGAAAIAATCMVTAARATDYHWGVASGNWGIIYDWNPNGTPGPTDNAYADLAGGATITVDTNVGTAGLIEVLNGDTVNVSGKLGSSGFLGSNSTAVVGTDGSAGTLNVSRLSAFQPYAGELDTAGNLVLGFNGGTGTFRQTGGTVNVGQEFFIGDSSTTFSAYNLSGGLLNVGNSIHVELGSSTVSGGTANAGFALSVIGNLDQSGGQINISGAGGLAVLGRTAGFGHYFLHSGALTATRAVVDVGSITYSGGSLSVGSLALSNLGQIHVTSGGGKVLDTTNVDISTLSSGSLEGGIDLADNAMVVDYTGTSALSTIRSYLHFGTWDSFTDHTTGIASSSAVLQSASAHKTALGYVEASSIYSSFPAAFMGQTVDSTSVLVRYVYAGDANIDGKVDLTDFTFLAANFNKPTGALWLDGDFNYDGRVDLTDFTFLASNFNQSLAAGGDYSLRSCPGASGAVVPEPTLLASLAPMSLGGRRRMRRRSSM